MREYISVKHILQPHVPSPIRFYPTLLSVVSTLLFILDWSAENRTGRAKISQYPYDGRKGRRDPKASE